MFFYNRGNNEPPHIEAEGNLSPDSLSNAREKTSAEASVPMRHRDWALLHHATKHCCKLLKVLVANVLFDPAQAISNSQMQSEHGIDVFAPRSSSSSSDEHMMACRTNTQHTHVKP